MRLSEQEMKSFVADVIEMWRERFEDRLGDSANVALFVWVASEDENSGGISTRRGGYGSAAFEHACEHVEALLANVFAHQMLLKKLKAQKGKEP